MNANELRATIDECINCITFEYKGKKCGVECVSLLDGIPDFDMWYGDKVETYHDVDTVMNEAFFDGKSLAEICGILDIWVS